VFVLEWDSVMEQISFPKPLSKRARGVLEEAGRLSEELGQDSVRGEHILLGLLHGEIGNETRFVLRGVAEYREEPTPEAIERRVMYLLFPKPHPGFPDHPSPYHDEWVCDADGNPKLDDRGVVRRYLADANSVPVRNKAGRVVRIRADDTGRPVRDGNGEIVWVEVEAGPDDYDSHGKLLGGP